MRRRAFGLAAGLATTSIGCRHLDRKRRPHDTSTLNTSDLAAALHTIEANGLAVMHACVDQPKLAACRLTGSYQSMPAAASAMATAEWRISAFGRYHRISFDEEDMAAFEAVERLFLPLVTAFFEANGGTSRDVYRSELQLLTATPESKSQMWHSDNQQRGLTVVVPLVDFTRENGATQLLPGSHDASWRRVARGGGEVVVAPVGSIVVYDARTYHRGLGNRTDESRPALVFRYDRTHTPPPGCGVAQALSHALLATALHMVASMWREIHVAEG